MRRRKGRAAYTPFPPIISKAPASAPIVPVPWIPRGHPHDTRPGRSGQPHCTIACSGKARGGQGGEELNGLVEKARKTGASEVHVADMREAVVREYLWRLVRSGGVYEHKYMLGTSIDRPLLAKRKVEVALAPGRHARAIGCTGKGTDHVRL